VRVPPVRAGVGWCQGRLLPAPGVGEAMGEDELYVCMNGILDDASREELNGYLEPG
jgi:hypothetical protein